jgi:ABC-2 type transport system permease protein
MNAAHIRTIISKEWAEVFKNKLVFFTVGFLPLIFTAMPLIVLYFMSRVPETGDLEELPPQFLALCGTAGTAECVQFFLVSQFLLLFMMMPLIIPVSIAAYSIVGEKTTRSLEPLLATPISTPDLLIGKGLSATIPAVLATWVGFAIFVVGAPLVGATPYVVSRLVSPAWLLAVVVVGPLMAIVAVSAAMIVSSRVSDPRVAEQMAAVVIVPVLLVLFGQMAGVVTLNLQFMLIAIAILIVADIALVFLATRLFEREVILTRWK